jgi:hypothetical protein
VGALLVAAEASALGPLDVEAGAKVGAGTNPIGGGFPNPLGVGVGGRAGVSLFGLYGGISVLYYLGGSGQFSSPLVPGITEGGNVSAHSLLYGAEVGYGRKLFRHLTLRGQLGLGAYTLTTGGTVSENSDESIVLSHSASGTDHYFYLEPGVTAIVTFGVLFFGVDINALLLPAGPSATPPLSPTSPFSASHAFDAALTGHGQIGIVF